MQDFKWIIQSNQIKDCPVTVDDVKIAEAIYGKDICALKGKTTRKKPIHVAESRLAIPKGLLDLHRNVYLTADLFFVNRIPFLATHSWNLCFTAVNHLAGRKVKQIFKKMVNIISYYCHHGFRITTLHVDGEFDKLKPTIESLPDGLKVNLASANEHVPEIKWKIHVIKE